MSNSNVMKRYKVRTRVLLGEANLTLTPDDVIEFDGVSQVRINGRDIHLPSFRHGVSKGWIVEVGVDQSKISQSNVTDRSRNLHVVDNDQFEIGSVKGREDRAAQVKSGRLPTSASTAFAPPQPRTTDRVSEDTVSRQDGYVIQEGIRIKTPAKMAKLDVTQANVQDIENAAYTGRLQEVRRFVREGIVFNNEGISPRAAGVPQDGNTSGQRSELWMEHQGSETSTEDDVFQTATDSDALVPSNLVSEFDVFQYKQVTNFIAGAPTVIIKDHKWELYNLLRLALPQLPEWNLKAHWRKKVADFNALQPLYQEIVRLFDDGVYLNHTGQASTEDQTSEQVDEESPTPEA